MADAVWYFADGDVERGPISEAQLRVLIGTGNLRPEDLVWKEGMGDWTPAGEVSGLFDPATSATPPVTPGLAAATEAKPKSAKAAKAAIRAAPASETKPRLVQMRFDVKRPLEIFRYAAFLGQPLLLVGLLFILLSRGCDRLGERHVARAQAQAKQAESVFQDEWDRQKQPILQELEDLQSMSDRSAEQNLRRDLLDEQLQRLNESKQAELNRLHGGRLRELNTAAREAEVTQVLGSFWREGIFWLGACLFSLALLIVGFSAAGPERWMALAMLAVIVFSLFVR